MQPALLEILRCPETGQRLALAPPELVQSLEDRRRKGLLKTRSLEPQMSLAEPIEAALVREDGAVCYLIQKGVPLLLPDHGIVI